MWSEECARAQVTPYLNLQGLVLAGEAILRWGTDDQSRRLLPPDPTGDVLWCQLFSEPDAGSDLASLPTRAARDGDRFVVDGRKVWCSNGRAGRVGHPAGPHRPSRPGTAASRSSCSTWPRPGVEVRPITQMTGDEEFCEVVLDHVGCR